MKPKDKERLVLCRPTLVRSLEIDALLPCLGKEKILSSKEIKEIQNDVRKRQRVVIFLDKLEKKKTETYTTFLDILADFDPHLYLMLTDEEFEGNPSDLHESLRDEESRLERVRDYLCDEIDAANVVPLLQPSDLLTEQEKQTIMKGKERKQRTDAMVDILDPKGSKAYEALIEAISGTYPHVYLALTGQDDLDDDSDDDFY